MDHMKTVQREYRGDTDKGAMIALTHASPGGNLHVVDLPYRLSSWALDDPGNCGLWFDARGLLVAWVVMQTPFWTIDYVCHPDAPGHLHRQVLAWADHRARQAPDSQGGHPCWFVTAFASQMDRIRDLEGAGFASQAGVGEESWSKVLMHRPCVEPSAERDRPAGFTIRPLAGDNEVEAYVRLHRAVFQSRNMTVGWRKRTLRLPEYVPDLDLVAVAPDGRLAAFCICWLDQHAEDRHRGQIEPMGVHADFRGLGLGRAILSEGIRHLHHFGAGVVCVETDKQRDAAMRLYEAVGFRVAKDVLVYRKDYGDTLG
jgi:ribosomal protein S18 acetylase RimI-like enzyme